MPLITPKPVVAKFIRALHSYSAMLVLLLLLFFSFTGITLNHHDVIYSDAGKSQIVTQVTLPEYLQYDTLPDTLSEQTDMAERFRSWLGSEYAIKAAIFTFQAEVEDRLLELNFKRPAGYGTVIIDFNTQTADIDTEFGGYLALLNDLHKGRNVGASWRFVIDFTAVSCIVFALTGFYLSLKQPSRRSAGNSLAMIGVFLSLFAYVVSLH